MRYGCQNHINVSLELIKDSQVSETMAHYLSCQQLSRSGRLHLARLPYPPGSLLLA